MTKIVLKNGQVNNVKPNTNIIFALNDTLDYLTPSGVIQTVKISMVKRIEINMQTRS